MAASRWTSGVQSSSQVREGENAHVVEPNDAHVQFGLPAKVSLLNTLKCNSICTFFWLRFCA